MTENRKGISGSALKLVAVLAMLLDHFGLAVLSRMMRITPPGARSATLKGLYSVTRYLGRPAFPIFCFLLVVGFDKTRNRVNYLARLGLFALISEVPYDLAFRGTVLEFGHQNVYFTLFLGLLALGAYTFMEGRRLPAAVRWLLWAVGVTAAGGWLTKLSWHFVQTRVLPLFPGSAIFGVAVTDTTLFGALCLFVGVLLLCYRWYRGTDGMLRLGAELAVLFLLVAAADLLHTDYGGLGVLTITVMHRLRGRDLPAVAGGCGVLLLKGLKEITAFGALLPVALYNGERGRGPKYLFYVFYPAHLLLLWAVTWPMGTAFFSVF